MTNIYTHIGIATVNLFIFTLVVFIASCVSDAIHEAKLVYKYKHRFDKPPTAACYCIDCKFHGNDTDRTRCTNRKDLMLQTADEWFCQAAEPKERGE